MARRSLIGFGILAGVLSNACSTWSSVHAGYGQALAARSEGTQLGIAGAVGGKTLETPLLQAGAQLGRLGPTWQADLYTGVLTPIHLGREVTLAPSAGMGLLSAVKRDGRWSSGALGLLSGAELVWWLDTQEQRVRTDFGCLGGMAGVDCPRCSATRVSRDGLGVRLSLQGPPWVGEASEPAGDGRVWLLVGRSHAVSAQEESRCRYDHEQREVAWLRPE